MMKMFAVGANHLARKVVLKVYAAKDIRNEINTDGLTFRDILGPDLGLMYVSNEKYDCLSYIKRGNFEGYRIVDDTDRIMVKGCRYAEET